jgi:uncharacterized protein (TIGR00296 family)
VSVYSIEEGTLAVKVARSVIEHSCGKPLKPVSYPPKFEEHAGVFVTINKYPSLDLRGCIGFPEPHFLLKEAIPKAAQGATRDPRFPPLRTEELEHIVVEVSVLTPPRLLEVDNPKDYLKNITIGRDGLIAARGPFKGLLLPQVPVEWNWDVEEFLSQTCVKAGLAPDSWFENDTQMYSFQAEIFSEERPRGRIVRKVLGGEE